MIVSYRSGTGAIFDLVCHPEPANATDCARTALRPSQCGHSQSPTSSTEANAATTVTTMPEDLIRQNNITEQTVGVSSLLGVGVVTALLTAALMVTTIGWITTCVYYQRKDKIQ